MKNKDFIKKSIEENIVDHTTVLNNLKAKASILEREKAAVKTHAYLGLKRAALVFSLLLITTAGIYGAANLFDNDKITIPPTICESSVAITDDSGCVAESEPSQNSQNEESMDVDISYGTDESEIIDDVSRQPSGVSEVIENTTELDEEDMLFFSTFSEEYNNFENLIYAQLQFEASLLYEGYAPVIDDRFQSVADIKKYLDSFLMPDCASDTYYSLISGDEPVYYERDNLLFIRTDYDNSEMSVILSETAKQVAKTEDELVIRASKIIGDSENSYFYNFTFKKGMNGEWLYEYDPEEINPF